MCVLLYNPTFCDDLEGLKWGHLDHSGALRGLARRTDLGFWGPDPTKSESRELSVYFFLVNLKQKVSNAELMIFLQILAFLTESNIFAKMAGSRKHQ